MASPYSNLDTTEYLEKTNELISNHPLSKEQIIEAVTNSWKQIFESQIGPLKIGVDIFPTPQVMSNIIHELIPHNLSLKVGKDFKIGKLKFEKDIEYIPNKDFSIELKISSHKSDIFANRSYAQPSTGSEIKNKNGYYIAVNIEKFQLANEEEYRKVEYDEEGNIIYPKITQIKFGYLEHSDWIAQSASTGQQARLTPLAKTSKLIKIYP